MIVFTQFFPLLVILPCVWRSAVAAETCKHNTNDAHLKFYRLMSFSNIKIFGTCIYSFFLARIQRKPEGVNRVRVTLVGLFPLHKGGGCDQIVSVKNYNGFQRLEAFVLALEQLNYKRYFLDTHVFIEAILYDTCSDKLAEHVSNILVLLLCQI